MKNLPKNKVFKAVLILTAACLLLLTLSGAVFAADRKIDDPVVEKWIKQFPDVPRSHWASIHIMRLTNEGAIAGMPDGTFGPERSITRAEFVTVVVGALLGKPEAPSANQHWAANIIKKAEDNNLLEAGEFATDTWNTPINRQEMAKIMARAMQYVQKEAPIANTASFSAKITDFASIGESYQPYVAQAYAKGIVTGYPDGSFGGGRQATRAEASTMVVRLLDQAYRLCEITFNPSVDVAADGRMKLAKAEQYLMKNLQSLKFYAENGKVYLEGNLVAVPAGFENWLYIRIIFKPSADLPIATYRTDTSILFHDQVNKLPGVGSFKEEINSYDLNGAKIKITSFNQIEDIVVTMGVRALNHTNTTYMEQEYEVYWVFDSENDNRIACINCIEWEKQVDKFYDLDQIFQW